MRDDFSQNTKQTLAKRVGMVCSNPHCRKATSGPRSDPAKALSIGVAAHIAAASPGGPRADATLSEPERSSIMNGIWLCQNCAKLVDNDESRYTAEVLRGWKREAEEHALRSVETSATAPSSSLVAKRKVQFTPGPEHITPETARQISKIVEEIVERLTASGGDVGRAYRRVWGDFNAHFGLQTYRELPRGKAEEGIAYLQQWRASSNSKLRFTDPEKFRTAQLRGIWPRSKALGFDDAALYQFAFRKLKLKSPISSLNKLGNQHIAKLNRFLTYEARKVTRRRKGVSLPAGDTSELPESLAASSLWNARAACPELDCFRSPTSDVYDCAWVVPWRGGLSIRDVELAYSPVVGEYDPAVRRDIQSLIRKWQPSGIDDEKIRYESMGRQVSLRGLSQPHGTVSKRLHLAPTNYLHYVAVHNALQNPELLKLRNKCTENALDALEASRPLLLPSHFAVHMAIISMDGRLIVRQRRRDTAQFPLAWEASVGEFMHGPEYRGPFPHFKDGDPSLSLFLKHAVLEELGYAAAKDSDFTISGFVVERTTLAPKLLAVYSSDAGSDDLVRIGNSAGLADGAKRVTSVPLSSVGLAEAFTETSRFAQWSPLSKLAALVAFMHGKPDAARDATLAELAQRIRSA